MERKKRSKGRGWESCYVKTIYGMFGVEMRAYGQKFVKFCTQTHRRVSFRPLFFNFLVYGFLGGKNGSVGRKNFFFSKGPSMSSCRKSYRYMEIVLKSEVLRN